MPFLFLRTASVLAAGFLLTGPATSTHASAGSAIGSLPATAVTPCPAHWATGQLPDPSAPSAAGFDSQIMSIATLSPTDVWMLINGTDSHGKAVSAVYHRAGDEWRESDVLTHTGGSFGAEWILARSDTDVWVIGSAPKTLKAWYYDGSSWTDHSPTRYSYAGINAVALGGNGVLYLAGSKGNPGKGVILGYGGSQWTDLSPANPPGGGYKALTVTADGTLIAAGGDQNGGGTLQERSGTTWTTVSLSAPVNSVTSVSVAPGGIVYGVSSVAGDQPVLIRQPPGSRSAAVLDPSAAAPATALASKTGVAALGLDVWLLGQGEPHNGWRHPWFAYDREFGATGRFSQVGMGRSSAYPRADRPCWSTAVPRAAIDSGALPSSSRCGRCMCHSGLSLRREGARRSGCRCSGLSLLQTDSDTTW